MRVVTLLALLYSGVLAAQPSEILNVDVHRTADQYRFDVRLAHPDTGWDHYANLWQVQDEAGNVLAERVLAHPHVNEQPFTRSVRAQLPTGLTRVYIVAGCTQDGLHPARTAVDLPRQ
ncbi:MAG: hypothetical protein ACPG4U_07835 [Pseudomonadales bacterium]